MKKVIAAVSAKLDLNVEQLGNPLRSDLPQVKLELPAKKVAPPVESFRLHPGEANCSPPLVKQQCQAQQDSYGPVLPALLGAGRPAHWHLNRTYMFVDVLNVKREKTCMD